jgi:hypothetical protein
LEIINSIINTSGIVEKPIENFVSFTNSSDIFKFSKFTKIKDDNGLLVTLRNSFDHNVISPITIQASNKMLFSDYINLAKSENKTLSNDELIKSAKEKQKQYPNAGLYRYDGKQWKHLIKVFAYINYSVLPNSDQIRQLIEKTDETWDVIQIILKNHQKLLPYLDNLKQLV